MAPRDADTDALFTTEVQSFVRSFCCPDPPNQKARWDLGAHLVASSSPASPTIQSSQFLRLSTALGKAPLFPGVSELYAQIQRTRDGQFREISRQIGHASPSGVFGVLHISESAAADAAAMCPISRDWPRRTLGIGAAQTTMWGLA